MGRAGWGVALLLAAADATAGPRPMALAEFIDLLQRQGYTILYSSDLVDASQRVSVDQVDLPALERGLAEFGLRLEQREGVWVIVRGTPPAPAEPDAPAPAADRPVLETVIVTGSLHHLPSAESAGSTYSFTPEALNAVPSTASDAMRVALRLPGISSVGVSARPQIRGGLADEMLFIQDGVELLEPFHLADYHSAYSNIDFYTVESLDVYTGGFPARYGNRMSGVMDIRNQWRQDRFNTNIGVSTFSDFANTRGDFGGAHPGSWFLSYRQGDLEKLTDYVQAQSGKPKYWDATARMNLAVSDRLELSFGGAAAGDDIDFRGEFERSSSNIDNYYLWSAADWQPGDTARGRLTLSWLDFERNQDQRSFEAEAKGGYLDYRQQVRRVALRNDWSFLRSGVLVETGWQLEYGEGRYDNTSLIDRGELADILGTQRLIVRDLGPDPDGFSGGAYLQAQWQPVERLTLQPSLRWDVQDYYLDGDSRDQYAARLGVIYDLNDETRARLSLGRFYQPEGIQELQVLDGVGSFFPPQHSDQVIAGLEWRRGALELLGDVYYKRYGAQKERFENVFNPFVLLPEMEPDRVGIQPSKARAQGIDLASGYRFSESLRSHLRYSYMDAQDRLDGRWVDRRWSQRHTVNGDLSFEKGGFSLSLAATWNSGWRSSKLPAFVPEGTVIPVATILNNTLLRDYFSIDIGAGQYWDIGRVRLRVYADISNVTDRHNQAGIDFDVENVPGGYELVPDQETVLGRIVSLGVTLSF